MNYVVGDKEIGHGINFEIGDTVKREGVTLVVVNDKSEMCEGCFLAGNCSGGGRPPIGGSCATNDVMFEEVKLVDTTADPKPERKSILTEANDLVNGERAKAYGDSNQQFDKVGQLATLMLNEDERKIMQRGVINRTIAIKVQLATKLAREAHKPKTDNRVDTCGYTELLDRAQPGEG